MPFSLGDRGTQGKKICKNQRAVPGFLVLLLPGNLGMRKGLGPRKDLGMRKDLGSGEVPGV